jgi:hypothetical protein
MASVSERTELMSERAPERSYAGPARTMLALCALAVALLPIPVALLHLVPTYRTQGLFLSFYAPTICLLVLGYLFYIRDTLARILFADLVEPLPERDPYYREPLRLSMRRVFLQLRRGFLIILPVVLVGISFYCVKEYAARFAQSVEIASNLSRQQQDPRGTSASPAPALHGLDQSSLGLARLRRHVLDTTAIDDVPLFADLTALYIGAFVAILAALNVMGLKEYAMDAMGVTEEDLVLGPESADGE